MKNINNIVLIFATIIFVACGSDSKNTTKNLADLKAERDKLTAQIETLEKENPDTTTTKFGKIKEIEITTMTATVFEHFIDVQGNVDGEEVVDINAKMPGTVNGIFAQEGKAVSKGQVLATLESESISKNLDALKTQYDLMKTLFEKQKSLWDQKIGTEVQFLQAKAQKESMEKQLAAGYEQLEMAKIKSPINGTLEMFSVKMGQYTMPGFPVARVVNGTRLKVRAELSENYASKVKAGNAVIVEFPTLNKSIRSTLSFASKYISPASRSFEVETKLPQDPNLRPNMTSVLKVNDYKKVNAMVVPVNIIQKDEIGNYLLVAIKDAKGAVAKKVNVVKGQDYNGVAEITSGLAVGDLIITKGYQDLNDGDTIKF